MIKLVICDLDNTLYDWVGYFVPAFDAMLEELVRTTGRSEPELLASFRRVHQHYGTSEYALAVAELDVLAELDGQLGVTERLYRHSDALDAFRYSRRRNLRLYPDVAATLQRLRDDGRTIVAHTDAMSLYARARLRQLAIEDLFDGLWACTDHDLPVELHHEELHRLLDADIEGQHLRLGRDVGASELKPEPAVVREIMDAVGVAPSETIYIGDSLNKDVLVAQRAGAIDVYAAYGRAHERAQYQRLVDVTHWTEVDVRRERELREHTVRPSFVAERFGDVVAIIDQIEGAGAHVPARSELLIG
jgi:FMN phosphatase YigB (HAD superfamily)